MESALFFIPSTSFCSLSSWFTSSWAYHLITVTTSLSPSITPSAFHYRLSQILSSIAFSLLPDCLHGSWTCIELSGHGRVFVSVSCARYYWSHSAFESTLSSSVVSYGQKDGALLTIFTVIVILLDGADIFSQVDANTLCHNVQNEVTLICVKFWCRSDQISKPAGNKTKWPRILSTRYICYPNFESYSWKVGCTELFKACCMLSHQMFF